MPLARPPVPPWLVLTPARNRGSHRKDFLAALLSFFSYILIPASVMITEHSTTAVTARFSEARSITDRCVAASTQICRIFLIWSITKIWPNYLSVFVMVCCTQHKSLPHLSLNQLVSQLHMNSNVQLRILTNAKTLQAHMVSPNGHILLNLPDFKHSKWCANCC